MKKEIYLFKGRKTIQIDKELVTCYEIYVDELSARKIDFLSHVLELTEEMSEVELTAAFSKALYEEIYMMTAMQEDMAVAMKKMLDGDQESVKIETIESIIPEEIKASVERKAVTSMIIQAKENADISRERIERCFACLYVELKNAKITSWMGKVSEDECVREIHVIVTDEQYIELKEFIGKLVQEIFGSYEMKELILIREAD